MEHKNYSFPEKNELKEATIEAIKELGGTATSQQINAKVAELLMAMRYENRARS